MLITPMYLGHLNVLLLSYICRKSVKIPKGQSEAATRRTDNTMAETKNNPHNDLQNTTQKIKSEQRECHSKTRVNPCASER